MSEGRKVFGGINMYPSAALADYSLVVMLPATIREQFEREAEYARQVFGEELFKVGEGQVFLAGFKVREEMEETLLRWLHRIVGQQERFAILFNNFGSRPGAPLYIRVHDPAPIRELADSLRAIDALMQGDEKGAIKIAAQPRLLLFKEIDVNKELELLLDFSGRSFRAEMEVEEILLLRSEGDGKSKLVSRLRLMPKGLKSKESAQFN